LTLAEPEAVKAALLFSENLLGIAIDTIGIAKIPLSPLGARDPKVVSLAITVTVQHCHRN
jgi:hypothetical protein